MHAKAIVLALFAASVAAAPGQAPPQQQSGSSSASTSSSNGASCNFFSCALALGPAGLKCIEFAFGGSGKDCLHGVLQDIEHMPGSCADCLNAIFD